MGVLLNRLIESFQSPSSTYIYGYWLIRMAGEGKTESEYPPMQVGLAEYFQRDAGYQFNGMAQPESALSAPGLEVPRWGNQALGTLKKRLQASKWDHRAECVKTAKCFKNGTISVKKAHFSTHQVFQMTFLGTDGDPSHRPGPSRFLHPCSAHTARE